MKKSPQFLIYLLILLVFISLFRLFSEQPAEEVSYSTFKTLMAEKRVKDLVISRDNIKGTRVNAKEGEKAQGFTVVRIEDPDLVKNLDAGGISYRGEVSDNWLRDFLLTWILPLVVLMVIWSFVFKRMGAGGPGRDLHELREVARQDLQRERRQGNV